MLQARKGEFFGWMRGNRRPYPTRFHGYITATDQAGLLATIELQPEHLHLSLDELMQRFPFHAQPGEHERGI